MTPEEIELLSELTVVIPTYNRPLELERAIEYWRDTPVTVHILDGSEKPWFKDCDILGASKINYHHLPLAVGEDWRGNYIRRIRDAGNLVSTNYASLCGDDDFFTVSGLIETIARLESDIDIDAVVGRCAIYRSSSKIFWSTKYLDINNSYKFRSENVVTRLKDQKNAPWIYYGVIRSELWRKLFALTFENKFNYPMTPFSVSRILDKALCKIVVLDRLVWIRREQVLNPASTHKNVNQILELLSGNRIVTRLKIATLVMAALKHSSDSKVSLRTKYIVWKSTSYKNFRNRRLLTKIYKKSYRYYRQVGLVVRRLSASNSPSLIALEIANKEKIKFNTNINECDLESFGNHLDRLKIYHDNDELFRFERLLLKRREELRLRANI